MKSIMILFELEIWLQKLSKKLLLMHRYCEEFQQNPLCYVVGKRASKRWSEAGHWMEATA